MRLLALAAIIFLTGCHSAFIEATVHNSTGQTLSPVELDYPSASFGIPTLAPNQDFHYRFKTQGSGDTKLIYTDSTHAEHTVTGPNLKEGNEGSLTIVITPTGVKWYQVPPNGNPNAPTVKLGTPNTH